MWDRPDILNRAASGLFVAAGLMIAYAIVWIAIHRPGFALRHVDMIGDTEHVTRAQVEEIVKLGLTGTFFTVDLPRLRGAFEKLPWVREVKLRRYWPDRLEVRITEQVALARWGSAALVNTQGEIFQAAYDGNLPVFVGPPGTSKEIAIQYEFFRRNLAQMRAKPVLVQLSARRAWQVKLDNGLTLQLGRDDVETRLMRFIAVQERTVGALARRIEYVDLRYPNGFAVRISELKGAPLPEGTANTKRSGKSTSVKKRAAHAPTTDRIEGAA
jgi:cell division protein FtsQ